MAGHGERSGGVVALLGPTNTGKTYRAIERLIEHRSGMIGLPLRLLAREVYDKVVARVGASQVALITGEEKLIPARPRYWVGTVEALPLNVDVDFVAIDEIQLAADPHRGHVFTDHLLRLRGRLETWFLGAATIEPLLGRLLPHVQFERAKRLSRLRARPAMSLGALPPRSAVVAFSLPRVYELAEAVRRRHGGCAVVLGALSPRTRNAQVAMYQAGEVDYLVATDAIGMGLNMDIDHVAFASTRKFDGIHPRPLLAAEMAQIAGRAGRAERDGTFGLLVPPGATSRAAPTELDPELVHAIEEHRFSPLESIRWRNHDLDMRSVDRLVESLKRRPPRKGLEPVLFAEDHATLLRLMVRPEVQHRAQGSWQVALLWDVCRVPDYRKLLDDSHIRLLSEIYLQLSSHAGMLDPDWMAERIDPLDDEQDNLNADIDLLMTRLAWIRTWTFVSGRREWVDHAEYWQERTRSIEDKLSDALHDRLTARFVERTGRRVPQAATRPRTDAFAALAGLADSLEQQAAAALPVTRTLLERVELADARTLKIREDGRLSFEGIDVGRMVAGGDLRRPGLVLLDQPGEVEQLRQRVRLKLLRDLHRDVDAMLAPLSQKAFDGVSAAARGLVYELERGLGLVLVDDVQSRLTALRRRDNQVLRDGGVVFSRRTIRLRLLDDRRTSSLRGACLAVWHDRSR